MFSEKFTNVILNALESHFEHYSQSQFNFLACESDSIELFTLCPCISLRINLYVYGLNEDFIELEKICYFERIILKT